MPMHTKEMTAEEFMVRMAHLQECLEVATEINDPEIGDTTELAQKELDKEYVSYMIPTQEQIELYRVRVSNAFLEKGANFSVVYHSNQYHVLSHLIQIAKESSDANEFTDRNFEIEQWDIEKVVESFVKKWKEPKIQEVVLG